MWHALAFLETAPGELYFNVHFFKCRTNTSKNTKEVEDLKDELETGSKYQDH